MDRDEFMELVYETFADEPDNVLANGIIEAADAYAEHEKAQLSQEGTTFDLISRQQAIDAANDWYEGLICGSINGLIKRLNALPPAQPERKKGKWIYNSPVTMKCDQCGLVIKDWDWHRFKFCPNCDCDMRGEQE